MIGLDKFRPYFRYVRPVRGSLILGIVLGVIGGGALSAGLPFMTHSVFPVIFADANSGSRAAAPTWLQWLAGEHLLLVACLMLPLVFVVSGVCGYFSKLLLNYVGLKVLEDLRIDVFKRLQQLSLGFHGKQKQGDLLSRVMGDTLLLQNVLSRVVSEVVVQPGALIGSVGMLIYLSLQDRTVFFMLIALMTVPLCVFPIRIFGKRLAKKAQLMMNKQGDISGTISENLASQQEIRAYLMEKGEVAKLKKDTGYFLKYSLQVQKYRYLVGPSVEIVSAVGVGIAIFFGAKHGLSLQAFLPLLMALFTAYEPIKKLGNLNSMLREGDAAIDRLEVILESEDEIEEPAAPLTLGEVKGEVSFEHVDFAYDEKEVVLRDVNVRIEAGEMVALVGESGAGKTTFVSMIPRFYDPAQGAVKLDGKDLRELSKRQLRAKIALVSQHPLLFRGSVADNIRVGRPDATDAEVREAARNASAEAFIEGLPQGFDTQLGERGVGLSGGQRQRVAIARAFLKDAPLLILDEATSALDSESEAQIQEAIARLCAGRTTFLIAHRFSSIRDAKRILVFAKSGHGGQIIGDGTHDALYASCEVYRGLYDKQSAN